MKLLISPLARGAYFDNYLDCARAEFEALFPEQFLAIEHLAGLDFLAVRTPPAEVNRLARLSFFQAAFLGSQESDAAAPDENNISLKPVAYDTGFTLPPSFVFGTKYAGKTNELVTQLALNLALRVADPRPDDKPRLLDPMAGQGSSLLWAARYGLDAVGIEQQPSSLQGFQKHIKRQTKLLSLKHSHQSGFIGKKNKQDLGRFQHYQLADQSLRLVVGDSANAADFLQGKRFDVLLSDLPYGIAHFTTPGTRNPLPTLERCAPQWVDSLKKGGAMVLIFNSLQPKRASLRQLFTALGMQAIEMGFAHRMSESIVRDLLILKKP